MKTILLALSRLSSAAAAQSELSQPHGLKPAPTRRAGTVPGLVAAIGGGLGFLSIPSTPDTSFGFALAGFAGYRFTRTFSARLLAGMSFTYFERIPGFANEGLGVVSWAGRGFAAVTEWWTSSGAAVAFAMIAALVAYSFLLAVVAVGVGLILVSPLAAASHLHGGAVGVVHLGEGATGLFAELGNGALAYLDRPSGKVRSGWGPLAGLGVRAGRVSISARVLASPPPLNESGGSVIAGALIVSGAI